MNYKKVKIPTIGYEEREYIETSTEVIILLGGIQKNLTKGVLRVKENVEKKGKELVLALYKPNTMSKPLGITYSKWCKENGIKYMVMPSEK